MKSGFLLPLLSLERVAKRIEENGYGDKEDFVSWLFSSVRDGHISVQDDLNGGNGVISMSLLKTADVQSYLIQSLGIDMLTVLKRPAPAPTQPPTPTAWPAIDWGFWRNMRTIQLWQACALVIGLDPDRLRAHSQAWMAGPGAGPLFEDRSFPNLEAKASYDKAVRLAENAVSYTNGPIYPQGAPHQGNNQRKDVLLSQVVAFFVSCEWANIPEQLRNIAQAIGPLAPPKPKETKEQRQDRRLAACESAGLTMPKTDIGRLPDGVGKVADAEGVSRQSFSDDVKGALKRRIALNREGSKMYRA